MTDATEDTQERPGPGGVLRSTREAHGYTLQDMADALNLTVRVVRDIEDERWERLPATTFAKGYLRAYAKLLGLDGDALIDSCEALRSPDRLVQPASRPALPEPRGLAEWAARQPGAVLSGAVVAAVCVVLVVLYLVWPDGGAETVLPPPAIARSEPALVAPRPEAARVAPRPQPASEAPRPEPARAADDTRREAPEVEGPGVEAPVRAAPAADVDAAGLAPGAPDAVAPEITPTVATAVTGQSTGMAAESESTILETATAAPPPRPPQSLVRRISPEGDDRVDFEFTEDCWVEVADAGGRNYADLSRAGDTLVLVGQAPFRIRLGYGPGASVAFNGEQVALAPYTRRNVTSLVLAPPESLDP